MAPVAASLAWLVLAAPGLAQEPDTGSEDESPGWSNATELSVIPRRSVRATWRPGPWWRRRECAAVASQPAWPLLPSIGYYLAHTAR